MKKHLQTIWMLALLLCIPMAGNAANKAEVREQLQQLLREEPQLIMELLREHSDELYTVVKEGAGKQRRRSMIAQWKQDAVIAKDIALKERIIRGNAEAPVTIVAFSDFTCPYCEQMAFTVNSLLEHYKGTVNFIFKNFPIESHEHAMIASRYFVAAGMQNSAKAWKFYDTVFANRQQLIEKGEAFLKETAQALGLNTKRLAKDAASKKVAARIAEDQKDAAALGITGTPYFMVNNIVIRGAIPFDLFTEAIEMALDVENSK